MKKIIKKILKMVKHRTHIFCLSCLGMFTLVACSSINTAPEKTYFVLQNQSSIQKVEISGTPNISIRRVKLPDYLNQQGIARQLENGQVNISYTDLWAEKLSQSVPTLLAENLSTQLGQPIELHPLPSGIKVDSIVEVHITRFIGSKDKFQLRAGYRIVKPNNLKTFTFQTAIPLSDNSTQTLVKAYANAIFLLSKDIAKHF